MGNLAKARYPTKHSVRGVDVISGRMTCNGAAAPTLLKPAVGWTAARTAAGNITVTLDQAYKRILFADMSIIGVTLNTKACKPIAVVEGGIRTLASVVFELQNSDGVASDQTIDVMFTVHACQVK